MRGFWENRPKLAMPSDDSYRRKLKQEKRMGINGKKIKQGKIIVIEKAMVDIIEAYYTSQCRVLCLFAYLI